MSQKFILLSYLLKMHMPCKRVKFIVNSIRGVTIWLKRIAIYCNTWQPYHNILPWDIIAEKRPNKHRNSSACWKLPSSL
jgi:hypothetical protein